MFASFIRRSVVVFCLFLSQVAFAQTIDSLKGKWVVDLRPEPKAPPYEQPFEVTSVEPEKRTFKGSFYKSEITWARYSQAWGVLQLTFITSDGNGEYVHVATFDNGTLKGTSTAKHRNLFMPWTAKRSN